MNFHCKGNSSLKAKVASKRAKAKHVWAFAASMSNLSKGQRWEAQRVAEQCLETGGMMFERSEFLPPRALRQAASGEVCTDWKMLQSNSWICSANWQHWQHIVVRSADRVCTARGAKRQCCQLLAANAVHDCPVFGAFCATKSTQRKTTERTQDNSLKVENYQQTQTYPKLLPVSLKLLFLRAKVRDACR